MEQQKTRQDEIMEQIDVKCPRTNILQAAPKQLFFRKPRSKRTEEGKDQHHAQDATNCKDKILQGRIVGMWNHRYRNESNECDYYQQPILRPSEERIKILFGERAKKEKQVISPGDETEESEQFGHPPHLAKIDVVIDIIAKGRG